MELKSRIVFLDTNIYEGKNFQFATHMLKSFKQLVDEGEIHLLITDPTIGEVKGHLKTKAEEAIHDVKKIKKSAMILRNVPDMPVYGIFSNITAAEVELELNRLFDEFLDGENVENVSIEKVSATKVFERYFSISAPFGAGEKRKEFADAYVLLALNELSNERRRPVHVITNDRDMHRFSEEFPNLICSESLDELVDAVNRAKAIEPAVFADAAFNKVLKEFTEKVDGALSWIEIEIIDEDWESDIELENVTFSGLELMGKVLVSVDEERCVYSVVFSVNANTVETIKDYDRSPFDSEEGRYPFVLETLVTKSFQAVEFIVELTIGYSDRIEDSIYIDEIELPDDIQLRNPIEEYRRALDINGD